MKRFVLLSFLAFSLAFTACAGEAFTPSAEAKALVKAGAVLVDVRTPEEFAGKHLDGAINIPIDDLEARKAAAMMAMTNVYFNALHLMKAPEYKELPSRLRLNRSRAPGIAYGLWCVAVSAINGCGDCLDKHEAELRRRGVEPARVQIALRIAAVVSAIARTLSAEAALRPQNSDR